MGYVYYGNYAMLYEIGRVEMLRGIGLSYAVMEAEMKVMMPVMTLNQRFVRPGRYDELLRIETTLRKLPVDTIMFYVEIFNETGELVNGGSVKLCFVDTESERTVPAPALSPGRSRLTLEV